MNNESQGKPKDGKARKIIIIVLIAAIVVAAGVAGALLYAHFANNKSDDNAEASTISSEETTEFSEEALEGILKQQMMYVNGINYYYQNSSEQLSHDAIGASVFNNSSVSIKSFVVAFCAFDAEGNPIKIVQPDEEGDGGYVRTINYDFALAQGDKTQLEPNETCKDILMYVKTEPQIVTVKACAKSYVSTDDVTWENPYYKAFLGMYSEKPLKQ